MKLANDIKDMPLDKTKFTEALLDVELDSQITIGEWIELKQVIQEEGERRGIKFERGDIQDFLHGKWAESHVQVCVDTIIKLSDPNVTVRKVTKHIRKLVKKWGRVSAERHCKYIMLKNPEHKDKFIKALRGMGYVY
tara:strand:- start:7319 stop:7729 length:411 start_codon:yes stop_codon:yes gene_type:complete